MYFMDDETYNLPHFHARYAEHEASCDFDGKVIVGSLPGKQTKLVIAWAAIHREELEALWMVMQTDDSFFKIKGLE